MFHRPKFKAFYRPAVLPPQTLFLLAEDHHAALRGRALPHLVPLLDGEHTVAELVAALDGRVSAPELLYTLGRLASSGYLIEADPELAPEQAALWQLLGLDARAAVDRLAAAPVALTSLGRADAGPLREALASLGVAAEGSPALRVVVTDHYLHPELAELNRAALAGGTPWALVRPAGGAIWVGPLFVPGQTGCWACLAQRLEANRQLDSFLLQRSGAAGPLELPLAELPASAAIAAQLAATEIARWIVDPAGSPLVGQVLTLDLDSLALEPHRLTRRPQCPACGEPGPAEPQPPRLEPRPKRATADGGHRSSTPEETYARLQHHVSPITGVINWLGDVTGGAHAGLAYSYGAGHNFALIQNDSYWLQKNLRSNTGGKGMSEIQAKVSAMGEAIERYSGVYRGDEPARRARQAELGDQAVPLGDCLGFSPAQYAGRHEWNARQDVGRFHAVANPFDPGQELDWAPIWSLSQGRWRYLPSSFCYYGHPDTGRHFFCSADGNGTSAGNSLEEAILQGFLELVERDSAAIWWYNRLPRPAVDLDSLATPYLDAVRAHYAALGRELWALDITSDLGIPSFAAISRRTDGPSEDLLLGLGAHLDGRVALLRAITELNQFLPAVARRGPDGRTIYSFPEGAAVRWWQSASLARDPYLAPDPAAPARRAAERPSLAAADLRADVEACVAIAGRAGLETLVLDQTRPDIGMPVARVVVPGLRHFWRRLGPGRLYDVPVRMGWLAAPTAEADLNPESIFF